MNKRDYFIETRGAYLKHATDDEIKKLWDYQEKTTGILNKIFLRSYEKN